MKGKFSITCALFIAVLMGAAFERHDNGTVVIDSLLILMNLWFAGFFDNGETK